MASSTGTWSGPFGYAGGFGYQEDATGLKLLGHRYYDGSTGRFLTRDPIKDGRNWYAYCENDPVNLADPTGLFAWVPVILAVLIIVDIVDAANDVKDIAENPGKPDGYIGLALGAVDPTPGNLLKKIGKGSRYIREPRNLAEQLAFEDAANGGGKLIKETLKDPRYHGWVKKETHFDTINGRIEIHYHENPMTGERADIKRVLGKDQK